MAAARGGRRPARIWCRWASTGGRKNVLAQHKGATLFSFAACGVRARLSRCRSMRLAANGAGGTQELNSPGAMHYVHLFTVSLAWHSGMRGRDRAPCVDGAKARLCASRAWF